MKKLSASSISVNTQPEDNSGIRLRTVSLLPPRLKNYECHFNWIQSIALSANEIDVGSMVLQEKFEDEAREIDSLLKTSGIKLISKKATQAFFHIEMKKFSRAQINLEEAKGFLEKCLERKYFYEEYEEGIKYVLFGLEMYSKVENGVKLSGVPLEKVIRFSRIPTKGKIAVWVMRDYFIEDCFRAKVERHDFMERMMEIEPYTIKWHFYCYKALREHRKLKNPFGSTLKIFPKDPLSISYVSLYLSEVLNDSKDSQYPTRLGEVSFETSVELSLSIRERAEQVLNTECDLDGVYLNFAAIYMFILSEKYRDNDLALRCVEKALKINPKSTTAHHRMGLLHFKMRNHKQAAAHLRQAINDRRNIGALYGLLQILMAAPVKNSAEISSLFKLFMTNPSLAQVWDNRVLRTLHYLKGCFNFMLDREDEAITSWIIAHDNGSHKWSYYFLNLSYQSHRFGWPTKRLNLNSTSNTLKHVAYIEKTQFRQVLLDICLEVDDAIRKDALSPWNRENK